MFVLFCNMNKQLDDHSACFLYVLICIYVGTERTPQPLEAGPEVRPRAYVPVCHLPALLHLLRETLDFTFYIVA